MKVSVNWLKKYADVDLPADKLVEKIGAQLGEVEGVVDFGKKYEGIVIAKVVSCQNHPSADKLTICKIDDAGKVKDVKRDENGFVQVVCGAPNVREGMLVAWIPPGKPLPATYSKDRLVLEAREIRDQTSNGMLASPSELDISDDHSGLLEVDVVKAKPGDDFAKTYELYDYIIGIENKMFTHRPDLFGTMGIARELAGIQGMQFKSPDWYKQNPELPKPEAEELKLEIRNELPQLVPRFTAIAMRNVSVGPSPLWLQILLSKLGMKSINNIVDYTNYYMYLSSQPLHAYDYDKVAARSSEGAVLGVRFPKKGEKVKLLNGKEIEPRNEAIMIAADKELIGIGGVMGGADTEVDENTKNIILESANFDMYSIRRTGMEHGLFTDAVTRFTKGQSPLQNLAVMAKIINEIQKSANGKVASELIDDNHIPGDVQKRGSVRLPVTVSRGFINSRLGLDLPLETIKSLLTNVEFEVTIDNDELTVKAPFWRTDIEIPEDVVEEVGRLYGYDHLPLELPRRNISPQDPDELLAFRHRLRELLASLGANEVLTYSFVPESLLEKVGQDKELAFKIANALSPDLQYYRLSLTPSLLDKVHMNIKAGYDEFALFEIGKVHSKTELDEGGLPKEFERLAFAFAASDKADLPSAAFYQARKYLNEITSHKVIPFNRELLKGHKLMEQMVAPYDEQRSGLVWNGKMPAGIVGEYKPDVAKRLKLPPRASGFEIFLSVLKDSGKPTYKPLSRYPSVSQDICLEVSESVSYGELSEAFDIALIGNLSKDEAAAWQPIDIYMSDNLKGKKRITYRITLTSYARTLTDEVLTALLDKVAAKLKESHDAQRI